jgi:hypothetical protein
MSSENQRSSTSGGLRSSGMMETAILVGQVSSRAIECNRRDRVAPESAPSTLRQPGSRPFSDLLHVLMKYLELRVSVKG